jgi:hypothetical protein
MNSNHYSRTMNRLNTQELETTTLI